MWIRLSKNMHDISCDMQAMTTEELKEFAKNQENVKRLLTGAYEAVEAVWKNYPEFKTVLLDTCSKEELCFNRQNNRKERRHDYGDIDYGSDSSGIERGRAKSYVLASEDVSWR